MEKSFIAPKIEERTTSRPLLYSSSRVTSSHIRITLETCSQSIVAYDETSLQRALVLGIWSLWSTILLNFTADLSQTLVGSTRWVELLADLRLRDFRCLCN